MFTQIHNGLPNFFQLDLIKFYVCCIHHGRAKTMN